MFGTIKIMVEFKQKKKDIYSWYRPYVKIKDPMNGVIFGKKTSWCHIGKFGTPIRCGYRISDRI